MVFMSPSYVLVLKLSKIVSFMQLFANISEKSKAGLSNYVHLSESSRIALLENSNGYYAMT